MMKLTTPEMASDPYTAEAPPVRTSTRSISAGGMKLMSGTGVVGSLAALMRSTLFVWPTKRAVSAKTAPPVL